LMLTGVEDKVLGATLLIITTGLVCQAVPQVNISMAEVGVTVKFKSIKADDVTVASGMIEGILEPLASEKNGATIAIA